jgi:hypothetical protein
MFRIGGYYNNTRFPAGGNPWSGALVQTLPTYTYFTPGQVPAAEELNYIFGGISDAAAAGASVAGTTWGTDVTPAAITGGVNALCAAAYDSAYDNQWILGISDGNVGSPTVHDFVVGSGLPGDPWATIGGVSINTSGHITSVAFDGTHYFATVIRTSDGALVIWAATPAGSFVATVTDTGRAYVDATIGIFNSKVVVSAWTSASTNSISWSTTVGALSWSSINVSSSTNATVAGFQASSPSLLVAIPSGVGSTVYGTSPDGVAWTSRTLPVTHGDTFSGLCYSPADGAFILMSHGTDSKGHTYVSYDGLNWSEQGTGMVSVPTPQGLAATNAGCIVAQAVYSFAPFPIYSTDMGASWHFAQLAQAAPVYAIKTLAKVAASPFNIFAFNNAHGRFSGGAGLSPAIT